MFLYKALLRGAFLLPFIKLFYRLAKMFQNLFSVNN
jgi:hypothetical protein